MVGTRSIPLSALELSTAMRSALPYDASRLDRVLRVDERGDLIEVQAATRWKEVAACLRPGDPRAETLGTAMPTVGGSLSCNAAGPDGRTAVTHVESMALVMPNGELLRVSRNRQGELFRLVAGGHGVFATLYSVTLHIGSLTLALKEAAKADIVSWPASGSVTGWRALKLLLPPERLETFLAEARAICEEWRMPLGGVRVRRTREEADTFLRWARRDYAAVTLGLAEPPVLGAAVRAAQLRRGLLDAAIASGGSFLLHCTPDATRAHTEACYPQLPKFLAEKRRLDPGERLVNAWYRHYRRLFGSSCAVRFAN
jgi:FAD/FMN-containing dehydrogenase